MDVKIVPGAEAFFYPGGRTGVLLVHGFTGSPAEMRLLGRHLNQAGFTVLGVRLPGHGTRVEELEHMLAEDWLSAVLDGFDMLAGCTDRIAAGGLSMGALLSLMLGKYRPVWKIFSIAAPVFIKEEKRLKQLPQKPQALGKFLPRPRKSRPGLPPECNICYNKMPLRSIHELLAVMDAGRASLPEVTAPLLIVQGRLDHTVFPRSAEYIYGNVASPEKELFWLEETGHRATIDIEREKLFAKVAEFLKEEKNG